MLYICIETWTKQEWKLFYFVEKWFPIDELDVAELSNSKKNSIPSNALQSFFPVMLGEKPESDQLCFWSICGHSGFLFHPKTIFIIQHTSEWVKN